MDFLSGCGPSPCSWYFYFWKVHVPTPSIFALSGFSDVVPNGILEGQARMLHLIFLRYNRHDRLVHPQCSLYSIPVASSASVFCCWRLDQSLLGIIGHTYLAHLFGVSLAFFGFHCRAPDWCISGIPYSSRSLFCWRFSGALAFILIVL